MSADIPFEPGSKNMDVEDMPFVPEIKNMDAAGIPFLPVGVTEQKKAPDRRSGPRPGVVTPGLLSVAELAKLLAHRVAFAADLTLLVFLEDTVVNVVCFTLVRVSTPLAAEHVVRLVGHQLRANLNLDKVGPPITGLDSRDILGPPKACPPSR